MVCTDKNKTPNKISETISPVLIWRRTWIFLWYRRLSSVVLGNWYYLISRNYQSSVHSLETFKRHPLYKKCLYNQPGPSQEINQLQNNLYSKIKKKIRMCLKTWGVLVADVLRQMIEEQFVHMKHDPSKSVQLSQLRDSMICWEGTSNATELCKTSFTRQSTTSYVISLIRT